MGQSHLTKIIVHETPGPIGIMVETTPFKLVSYYDKWIGEEHVVYYDSSVEADIAIKGYIGQPYTLDLIINDVTKVISGFLGMNGRNDIRESIPLTYFIRTGINVPI